MVKLSARLHATPFLSEGHVIIHDFHCDLLGLLTNNYRIVRSALDSST